jgi:hypothetical protein
VDDAVVGEADGVVLDPEVPGFPGTVARPAASIDRQVTRHSCFATGSVQVADPVAPGAGTILRVACSRERAVGTVFWSGPWRPTNSVVAVTAITTITTKAATTRRTAGPNLLARISPSTRSLVRGASRGQSSYRRSASSDIGVAGSVAGNGSNGAVLDGVCCSPSGVSMS